MQRRRWRRTSPQDLAKTHGKTQSFFDYDALTDIVAKEQPVQDRQDLRFLAIDSPETEKFDDAIAIEPEGKGFRVYSAISAVSRHTRFVMKQLPYEFSMSLSGPRQHYSLSGKSQALVIDFWADGEDVGDANIYLARLNAEPVDADKVPIPERWDLQQVTNAKNPQSAVSRIMTMHNTLLASWALRNGVAIPLYNNVGGKRYFSIHADGNESIGRGVKWYTHGTNPLRAQVDRVTDWQIIEALGKAKSVMSVKNIDKYCAHVNENGCPDYEIAA